MGDDWRDICIMNILLQTNKLNIFDVMQLSVLTEFFFTQHGGLIREGNWTFPMWLV